MTKESLDQFYTKPDIARQLLTEINIDAYEQVIEPSAGRGAFSLNIENCMAYDLEPCASGIMQQDFLTLTPDDLPAKREGMKRIFIGNPPFGKRSQLAKQFITHSIYLGADTIAFILPDTFSKLTNQKVFPSGWRLENQVKLEDSLFELPDGSDYYVPCTFYIWTQLPGERDLRKYKLAQPDEFEFLKRGHSQSDFTINGTYGRVKELDAVTNPKAEHYVRITERNKVGDFKKIFNALDYPRYSSVSGGNYWISQQEILEAYYQYKNKKEDEL